MADEERLRSVMRALAIADDKRSSLTLEAEDVRVLCARLRLASIADGRAILYVRLPRSAQRGMVS